MSKEPAGPKHLPKIFSEKVARDRVRFWYQLIAGVEGLTPRELEIKFSRGGKPLDGRKRGSRIWAKYRAGEANPMVGDSAIADVVDQSHKYKQARSKYWLEIDIWRLMDEDHLMTHDELWGTFKKLPNYWRHIVAGRAIDDRKKFWRIISDEKREALLEQVDIDLGRDEFEDALRAIYTLVQDALLRQSESDYIFWRKQAERVEQDPNVPWIGRLPRIRGRT